MKIYLDCCCLNRPFDDPSQERVRQEAEAVLVIVKRLSADWIWIGSEALDDEIERISDPVRRRKTGELWGQAQISVAVEKAQLARARELTKIGLKAFDALHIACAESGGADVLLTTDDKLLRRARRHAAQLNVRVANPLTWLAEQAEGKQREGETDDDNSANA